MRIAAGLASILFRDLSFKCPFLDEAVVIRKR
jgi:hypothetical protein